MPSRSLPPLRQYEWVPWETTPKLPISRRASGSAGNPFRRRDQTPGIIVDAVAFFCLQMIQTRVVIDCQAQHLVMLRPEDGLVDLQDGRVLLMI